MNIRKYARLDIVNIREYARLNMVNIREYARLNMVNIREYARLNIVNIREYARLDMVNIRDMRDWITTTLYEIIHFIIYSNFMLVFNWSTFSGQLSLFSNCDVICDVILVEYEKFIGQLEPRKNFLNADEVNILNLTPKI